jgi:hypothetical protein
MTALDAGTLAGNAITALALALAGAFALSLALWPRRAAGSLPAWAAWACGAGLIALAADEGFDLHERVGGWLWNEHGVGAPGPVNHVDDLFVIAYLVAGACVFTALLPVLRRDGALLAGLLAAGTLMAAGTAVDALGSPGSWTEAPEEALEVAGAVVLAAAFGRHALARDGAAPATGYVPAAEPATTR